jgi:transposase
MIQLSQQNYVYAQIVPIDFRKGLDSLIGVCRGVLKKDPFSGAIFAFRNRKGTAIKLITYDGSGFWLMHKRFSTGTLKHWPKTASDKISGAILMVILNQGSPGEFAKPWRPLDSSNASMAL